jgi:fluoroquinolone resistance protein
MGIDFTVCDPTLLRMSFEKCLLSGCNFTEMELKVAKFVECIVKQCHFVQCNLEKSNFHKANLAGSTFHHANLGKADFREAINYTIHPLHNDLKGAKFSQPEALSLLNGLEISIE